MEYMNCYDNSLTEIEFILPKFGKWMPQGRALLSLSFISNFHWRRKQNKARRSKAHHIASFSKTMLRALFRRDPRVQIPSSAHFCIISEIKGRIMLEKLLYWAQTFGLPGNVWVGVTMCNQLMVKKALKCLSHIDAAVKYICVEPLQERITVDLTGIDWMIIRAGCEFSLKGDYLVHY